MTGHFTIQHQHYSGSLRPIHKFLSKLTTATTRWQKAHCGEPFNELADHLAKIEASSCEPTYHATPIHPEEDRLGLAWLWQDADSQEGGPFFTANTMYLPVPDQMTAFDLQAIRQEGQPSQERILAVSTYSGDLKDVFVISSKLCGRSLTRMSPSKILYALLTEFPPTGCKGQFYLTQQHGERSNLRKLFQQSLTGRTSSRVRTTRPIPGTMSTQKPIQTMWCRMGT